MSEKKDLSERNERRKESRPARLKKRKKMEEKVGMGKKGQSCPVALVLFPNERLKLLLGSNCADRNEVHLASAELA